MSYAQAKALDQKYHQSLTATDTTRIDFNPIIQAEPDTLKDAVLATLDSEADLPSVTYRPAGNSYLLVEYGELVLDLNLRFRIHALMQWVKDQNIQGIIDLTPGIRSLQIHFDQSSSINLNFYRNFNRQKPNYPIFKICRCLQELSICL